MAHAPFATRNLLAVRLTTGPEDRCALQVAADAGAIAPFMTDPFFHTMLKPGVGTASPLDSLPPETANRP